jgi:hypothetical protein
VVVEALVEDLAVRLHLGLNPLYRCKGAPGSGGVGSEGEGMC